MRLHRLDITAFGPFAESVAVDFDRLSEAGLFLLTGATGAGKSSVLDAVCFALYGDVPGDRSAARRLRCDQAAPDLAPAVVLEATLAGRRFRIERSPAWERPKKRGTGTTVQQASVCLSERTDGGWRPLSTRLDETGHLVTRLVGMNLGQFCQVALLPQGRFQAFLRARSEDRHALLQQVFRTDRFDRVEKWLRDHRVELRRASERHERVLAELANRVSETADDPTPVEWEECGLGSAAESGAVEGWAVGLWDRAGKLAEESAGRVVASTSAEEAARAALEAGRATAGLQSRHAEAHRQLEQLDADAAAHERRCDELESARRAHAVVPVLDAAEQATAAAERAAREAAAAIAAAIAGADDVLDDAAEPLAAEPTGEAIAARRETAVGLLARVRATLPRAEHLATVEADLAAARRRVDSCRAALASVEQRCAALPGEVARVRALAEEASRATDAASALAEQRERLCDRVEGHRQLARLEPRLADARDAREEARDRLQLRREEWLTVREARLEGMAAEIAARLAVGGACPVCGSAEHPRPAVPAPGAPDAAAEKVARREVDDAEVATQAADEQVRTLETGLAVARQRAGGGNADGVSAALAGLEEQLATQRALADTLDTHREELAGLAQEQESLADDQRRAAVDLDEAHQEVTALVSRRDSISDELDTLLDGTAHDTLADLEAALARRTQRLDSALAALERRRRAAEAADAAWAAAASAAAGAGFTDADAVRAARRTAAQVTALAERVRADDRARAAAEQQLADPDVVAAASRPAPDLAGLARDLESTAATTLEAREERSRQTARADRLGRLCDDLREALTAWLPVREQLALATRVAALVDGTSPDNRLRMRLSAYVLSHRLGQVVAAANERLSTMSDRRYSLEHSGRRGAGETRGGLSLLVRDDWSGERRDPATLSGGETFVVSLALALGLADVITQEAGGADLDTLFVDEGFGSLDADTLDDVMDTLDTLRDGGRVVGVVSHVAEMRDRIPAQLRVAKRRTGSTLAAHLA